MVLAAMAAALTAAAPTEAGPAAPGAGAGEPPAKVKMSPEEKSLQRYEELLGASDEEWAVIEPRLAAVVAWQREAGVGGANAKVPKGNKLPKVDAGGGQAPLSQAGEQAMALRELAMEKDARAGEMKERLERLRAERVKAKEELHKARERLRELLSVRQEVILVLAGVLD
jgi:hypothetical protein